MTARERYLDVSMLEPCEPLERSQEAAATLEPGEFLHIRHRREPFPLYDLLERQGMVHHTVVRGPGAVEIFVFRRGDAVAEAAVEEALEP